MSYRPSRTAMETYAVIQTMAMETGISPRQLARDAGFISVYEYFKHIMKNGVN